MDWDRLSVVTNSLFYALLPILAALPYAGTYYEDIRTGYLKNILLHTSRRGYYMAKSFVVFVMAAITVMIPLLLDLMAVMTIYPLRMPERLEFLSAGILDVNLFPDCMRQTVHCMHWHLSFRWFVCRTSGTCFCMCGRTGREYV